MSRLLIVILLLFIPQSFLRAQVTEESILYSHSEFNRLRKNSLINNQWVPLGPALNGARAEAVQAHPDRPEEMYVAFGSGNLWKTVNGGLSWIPIFEGQASMGIGDFAIAPSNPDILYVGTGESLRKARNFTMPGSGIYKSEDGGESWKHAGLARSRQIGEIAIHPTNPDLVLVALLGNFWSPSEERGIFRSEDGGRSWDKVLYVDGSTGANDLVISPSDPNYMYATFWEFKAGVEGDKNYNNVGKNSALYHSSDAGKTWSKARTGLPVTDKTGRMSVAVSHSNPLKAYVLVDNQANDPMETAEVYKTLDGGISWQKTHTQPLHFFSVVGWYFTDIYTNPMNDEEIFGLGVRLANSRDGGKTFSYIGGDVRHLNPSAAQGMHLDHCEMWIDPNNPDHLLLANDGGLYRSMDHGKSWLHFNNIPAGEFYDITLSGRDDYLIYGGVQDDATVFGPPVEFDMSQVDRWEYLWIDPWNGGDGCVTQVDPDDPTTIYFSMQEGAIRRLDKKTGLVKAIKPKHPESDSIQLRHHFITPYFISSYDSKTLYHGGNYVFRSRNRGDKWDLISPDLTRSSDPEKASVALGALVESNLEEGVLYAGTDKGGFWFRDQAGKWNERSVGLPKAYMRSISPSNHKMGRVYAALTGLNNDDLRSYLFASENHGESWKSIVGNLPSEPVNVILEDPSDPDILYAGTFRGMFISYDRGSSWSSFGKGLPQVSIADIEIHDGTKDLVIATHGRGIFRTNLGPVRQVKSMLNAAHLFEIPAGVRPTYRTPGGLDQTSIRKITISYWLKARGTVSLRVQDNDDTLWSADIQSTAGLNEFRWDLKISTTNSDQPYFIHYNRYLEKGEYQLILSVNEQEFIQKLIVKEPLPPNLNSNK